MKFKGLELDKFQEDAIAAIEANKSVVVCAPTGSGKTLIADYIINRDHQLNKRVVYTAPIKALSNQKYHDFVHEYGEQNVGLLTGDIVTNPSAPILVMTTEVYRNMVVVQDEMIPTISYCIFDEIHFISDIDRGTVWEESIIFSPPHIRFLCLSATIPNSKEFAAWIQSIKNHEVVVIEHHHRPVPLAKLFFDSELGITTLNEIKELQERDRYPQYQGAYKQSRKQIIKAPNHLDVINAIKGKGDLPCIYFVFSRADCQKKASELSKKFQFLTPAETAKVGEVMNEHLKKVDPTIQKLDSARLLAQLLPKGIGFHHAGLLPMLKHIVEQLFGQGLIKVLYATETFAVGINMPAKAVCFNSLRKYDGIEFRYLNSKEYFQLAGRAGRRGIDTQGKAIAVINRQMDDLKKIKRFTTSDTEPIKSQFKLSYNTVLNLIEFHQTNDIERILRSNFYAFQKGNMDLILRRFETIERTLAKMGYLEAGRLTDKGQFIRNIFVDELSIGEMFSTNFYEELNEYQVLLIVAALCFEARNGITFAPAINSKDVKDLLRHVSHNAYLKRIKKLNNALMLSAIMQPCFEGKKFIHLLEYTNLLEGDLMRFLRQIVDRLTQIKKASNNIALDKLTRNCIAIIDRCLEGIELI